ncbi:MAG TPA: hypothetical protein VFP72_11975 [Kineosporiaceae bacterium]|nr:hypothetical protein [Kineosporiaceae bacterium]
MSGDSDHDGEPAPGGEPENWGDVDVDAAFAAIVAQFAQTDPHVGPWPVAEDLDGPRETSAPTGPHSTGGGPSATGGPSTTGGPSATGEHGPSDPAEPGSTSQNSNRT